MQGTSIRYTQGRLGYRVSGSGAPVVLLHGFGEDGNIWYPFVQPLERSYTLLVPDLPGIGHSEDHSSGVATRTPEFPADNTGLPVKTADTAADTAGITLEQVATHIKEMLDAENISECSMIGHSMGGYITLAFAEQYGERLTRMGLFHSSAFADSDEKKLARQKNIRFLEKHGTPKFQEQTLPNLFAADTRQSNPSIVSETIQQYKTLPATSLIQYTLAMMRRPDRKNVLAAFPNPVLFLLGEHDTAIPVEQGLQQCHIPQLSYIYIAAHSGHMGMLEEPEFCLQAIGNFLAGK